MNTDIMTTTENKTGYLELIIGPMFSSKTSSLLEIYKQCKDKKQRFNYSFERI